MPSRVLSEARRQAASSRTRLKDDLVRLTGDAGLTVRQLASEGRLSHVYVAKILRGEAKPTLEAYAKLAAVLGADLSTRLYPNTGPAIRDRHQAPILEWLLQSLHPRWRPFTEVAVWQPARGWIDAVLHEARAHQVLATEIESELRRLEQQVRWSQEKAAALPSWSGWSGLSASGGDEGGDPAISRLLIVRRTRATRAVAAAFGRQLSVAYPAHPDDAMAALAGTGPWPGPALVWVTVDTKGVRFAPGR